MTFRILVLLRRGTALLIDLFVWALFIFETGALMSPWINSLSPLLRLLFASGVPTLLLVCRDVLGRSIGKWVMQLKIVQKNGSAPSVKKLFLRGLFVPLALFDAIGLVFVGGPRPIDRYLGLNVVSAGGQ
jgi:uncharacterized RDD family membrane protein YckC